MARVSHFDIVAKNPERLAKFYKSIFGWNFEKWDGPMDYWMITTGDKDEVGINGGMSKKEGNNMMNVNTISVDSVDKTTKKLEKVGGKIIMPKMAIPSVGWIAYFEDPEGNKFGIMEEDLSAE